MLAAVLVAFCIRERDDEDASREARRRGARSSLATAPAHLLAARRRMPRSARRVRPRILGAPSARSSLAVLGVVVEAMAEAPTLRARCARSFSMPWRRNGAALRWASEDLRGDRESSSSPRSRRRPAARSRSPWEELCAVDERRRARSRRASTRAAVRARAFRAVDRDAGGRRGCGEAAAIRERGLPRPHVVRAAVSDRVKRAHVRVGRAACPSHN